MYIRYKYKYKLDVVQVVTLVQCRKGRLSFGRYPLSR